MCLSSVVNVINRVIVQVDLASLVMLGGTRVFVPRCVFHHLKRRFALQRQRDKGGAQIMGRQVLVWRRSALAALDGHALDAFAIQPYNLPRLVALRRWLSLRNATNTG